MDCGLKMCIDRRGMEGILAFAGRAGMCRWM